MFKLKSPVAVGKTAGEVGGSRIERDFRSGKKRGGKHTRRVHFGKITPPPSKQLMLLEWGHYLCFSDPSECCPFLGVPVVTGTVAWLPPTFFTFPKDLDVQAQKARVRFRWYFSWSGFEGTRKAKPPFVGSPTPRTYPHVTLRTQPCALG